MKIERNKFINTEQQKPLNHFYRITKTILTIFLVLFTCCAFDVIAQKSDTSIYYIDGMKVIGSRSTYNQGTDFDILINDTSYFHNQKIKSQIWSAGFICDTIHDFVDVQPKYQDDEIDLLNYLSNMLLIVINECQKRDEELIDKLLIYLTINREGKVIDATFLNSNASEICQQNMKSQMLKMKNWKPAEINGKAVCSKYRLPINCLNWEE